MQFLAIVALLAALMGGGERQGWGTVLGGTGSGTARCSIVVNADDGRAVYYLGWTRSMCRTSLTAKGTRVAFTLLGTTKYVVLLIEDWAMHTRSTR